MTSNILIVWTPSDALADERAYRDYIIESLRAGVLVLPSEFSCEVMELPRLGRVEVLPAEEAAPAEPDPEPPPESPTEAEEKRAILQRLKDYRAAHGLGSLEAVSVKTAHQKGRRLSAETLRYLCANGAPKMPMEDWYKISRALERLEGKE